ncbi:MAG TPA: HEAT repeat domain-containing protein [Bacillota bacterium]|nr:HEAT repeat domain-containing protein [Bacillota bacterium]
MAKDKMEKLESKLRSKIENEKLRFVDNLLGDPDKNVRLMAISVVSEYKMQAYLTTFIEMVRNPGDKDLRVAAAKAVGTIGWEPSFSEMLQMYEKEEDPDVKEAIRLTMRQLHAKPVE